MKVVANAGAVATSVAAKTLVQVLAATAHSVKVTEVGISFGGTNANDNLARPIIVELLIQTTAGTASSLTLVKSDQGESTAIDSSAQETFTAEPTASDIIRRWTVHPQAGPWVYSFPDPITIPAGSRIALRTSQETGEASVDAYPYIEIDE